MAEAGDLFESGNRGGLPEISSGPVETDVQEGTLLEVIVVQLPFTSSSMSGLVLVGVVAEGRRFNENLESFIDSLDRDLGGLVPSTTTASTVSSPSVNFS